MEISGTDGTLTFKTPETIIIASGASFANPEVPGIDSIEGRLIRADRVMALEIDRRIKKMVQRFGDSKAVMGFYITDEPGASAFSNLAKAVKAVKKYAPGKLAFINLYPNYASVGAPGKSQLETKSYMEYVRTVRQRSEASDDQL